MIVVKNRLIPFKGFNAMCLWPFIFVRKGMYVSDHAMRHERIHGRQQVEMLLIFFYLWYLVEWVIRGYRNISFEQEAYDNEDDVDYLKNRKYYAWTKYL